MKLLGQRLETIDLVASKLVFDQRFSHFRIFPEWVFEKSWWRWQLTVKIETLVWKGMTKGNVVRTVNCLASVVVIGRSSSEGSCKTNKAKCNTAAVNNKSYALKVEKSCKRKKSLGKYSPCTLRKISCQGGENTRLSFLNSTVQHNRPVDHILTCHVSGNVFIS